VKYSSGSIPLVCPPSFPSTRFPSQVRDPSAPPPRAPRLAPRQMPAPEADAPAPRKRAQAAKGPGPAEGAPKPLKRRQKLPPDNDAPVQGGMGANAPDQKTQNQRLRPYDYLGPPFSQNVWVGGGIYIRPQPSFPARPAPAQSAPPGDDARLSAGACLPPRTDVLYGCVPIPEKVVIDPRPSARSLSGNSTWVTEASIQHSAQTGVGE